MEIAGNKFRMYASIIHAAIEIHFVLKKFDKRLGTDRYKK